MEPVRPEFVPEAGLGHDEMKAQQRAIACKADFSDRLEFNPAEITLSGADQEQSTLTDDSPTQQPIIAGVDQAFLDERAISAIVAIQGSEVIERTHAVTELSIPYIPGLLAFREGHSIVEAFNTLGCEPDLAVFDGSGRIHYRQAGLATHMGVVFDLPAVGVAKSLLCGEPRQPVENRPQGWRTPIEATDHVECPSGTIVGYAYQSRQYESGTRHINPVYVSPGHRVSAETAVDLVAAVGGEYKLPEPTRLADQYVGDCKRRLDN